MMEQGEKKTKAKTEVFAMLDIEEKKKSRFTFLKKLHELSDGNERASFNMFAIGETFEFDRELTVTIINYLENMGLIKWRGSGDISISHDGSIEIEAALSQPDKPTKHFSPVGTIIAASAAKYALSREDSPVTQNMLVSNAACERLQALILLLKESIDTLNLEPEKRRDLTADIHTIEAQMTSSQPKTNVLAPCLDSIQEILKGKAGSACASKLLMKLEPVYVQITHQR
jgi:hypothetical protein